MPFDDLHEADDVSDGAEVRARSIGCGADTS